MVGLGVGRRQEIVVAHEQAEAVGDIVRVDCKPGRLDGVDR